MGSPLKSQTLSQTWITVKFGLAEIFLHCMANRLDMGSLTKIAQSVAGLIFFLGGFASLEYMHFPDVNMLTIHLYVMLVAGLIMFVPVFIEEKSNKTLDTKIRRMEEDLKTIKKQFPDTRKKE